MNKSDATKRQRAAALIVEGYTGAAIAAEVRIRQETLSRWRRDATFQAMIQAELERRARGKLEDRLQALAPDALSLLAHALTLKDLDGPKPQAIAAAGLILEAAIVNPKRSTHRSKPHAPQEQSEL